jgi:P-type Cu+ transporter
MKNVETSRADSPGTGAIYTCPMHPQIRHEGPGNCPICGMTLEPLVETAVDRPNAELTDISRRFWIGPILTIPVFVLEMGSRISALGLDNVVAPRLGANGASISRRRTKRSRRRLTDGSASALGMA